jgi:hypothetical protein
LQFVAVVAAALGASAADAGEGWWNPDQSRWNRTEWMRPPQERSGFLNQNGCSPGTHGVPYPNGNGFRCVLNGWAD